METQWQSIYYIKEISKDKYVVILWTRTDIRSPKSSQRAIYQPCPEIGLQSHTQSCRHNNKNNCRELDGFSWHVVTIHGSSSVDHILPSHKHAAEPELELIIGIHNRISTILKYRANDTQNKCRRGYLVSSSWKVGESREASTEISFWWTFQPFPYSICWSRS
jgi:hypothetical protein